MAEEKENFLDRWSRRKQEQAAEAAAPVEKKEENKDAKDRPLASLPKVEDLKPDSDFKPFMDRRVDPATRRAALKKLFVDEHFKMADPFEPYSGDFTIEDPIPDEMLKTLNHARQVLFEEKKQAPEQVAEQAQEPLETAAAEKPAAVEKPLPAEETILETKNVAGKQDA